MSEDEAGGLNQDDEPCEVSLERMREAKRIAGKRRREGESFDGVVVNAGPKGQHMTKQMDVTIRIFESDYDKYLSKQFTWVMIERKE